jgi:ABC-2 type transport system permease protein
VNLRAIKAVAIVEAKRLLRARMALSLLLIVPIFQIILFGYAIRPNEARVRVVIAAPVEQSGRAVVDALRNIGVVDLSTKVGTSGSAEQAVRSGAAIIGVELPRARSFADPAAGGGPIRVIVDATNPVLTTAIIAQIQSAYHAELVARSDLAESGPGLMVERLFNPDARSDWTFASALAGVTVMIAMVMLGSISISREREGGSWETFSTLPITPMELVAGKLLPNALMGTIQGALVMMTGHLLFALPLPWTTLALTLVLPIFAAAHFVIGFAISARASTQLSALQGAIAFYLPAMLLSGFLYPFETLPPWAQAIGNIFPLSHFIRAAQDAMLRERDISEVMAHGLPILLVLVAGILFVLVIIRGRIARL